MLGQIFNMALICNPAKYYNRVANAIIQCYRIANPTEKMTEKTDIKTNIRQTKARMMPDSFNIIQS